VKITVWATSRTINFQLMSIRDPAVDTRSRARRSEVMLDGPAPSVTYMTELRCADWHARIADEQTSISSRQH
jgi:hypothetical protein